MSGERPLSDRLRSLAGRAVRYRLPARSRSLVLGIAGLVFVAATALAVSRLPPLELDLRWIAGAALLAISIPAVNAAEFVLAGRWSGVRVSLREALTVTVLASAANLAPVPGAALIRGRALLTQGGNTADVARSLGVVGAAWFAVSLVVAGLAVAASGRAWVGVPAALAGCGAMCVVLLLLPGASRSPGNLLRCLALESAAVAAEAVRLAMILKGLGFEGRLVETLALPAAAALASAGGVVPGGLGLRELIAGGISPLAGLPVSRGITSTAVDRLLGLGVLAAVCAIVLLARRGEAEGREA